MGEAAVAMPMPQLMSWILISYPFGSPFLKFNQTKSHTSRERERHGREDDERGWANKSSTGAVLNDHRHPPIAAAPHLLPEPSVVAAAVLLLVSAAAAPDFSGGVRDALHWDLRGSDALRIRHFRGGNRVDAAGHNVHVLLLFCRNSFQFLQNHPRHLLACSSIL